MGKMETFVRDLLDRERYFNDSKRKKALLLHHAGTDVHDIYFAIPGADDLSQDEDPYVKTVKVLDDYFLPKVNVSYERHKFHSL